MLPDVLHLWDCLFADKYKFSFLFYLCVAVLRLHRTALLKDTAAGVLERLQDIRSTVNVADLSKEARVLYKRHGHGWVHKLNGEQ